MRLKPSAIAAGFICGALAQPTEAHSHEKIAQNVAQHADYRTTHGNLADSLRAMDAQRNV